RGALAERGVEAAIGDRAPPIRAAERISGVHEIQPVPARPLPLRLLRVGKGADVRSRAAARQGRADDVGKCRDRLRAVQFAQGRTHAGRGAYADHARADSADQLAIAGPWTGVPAQPFAREL